MRIYVAGPYSAPTKAAREYNARVAITYAHMLYELGHNPFIPHLSHWTNEQSIEQTGRGLAERVGLREHEFWLDRVDREWLQQCEALFYIGPSTGALKELAWAKEWAMPVFTDIAQVPPGA